MFVPLPLFVKGLLRLPGSGWQRKAALAALYVVLLATAVAGARVLESHSLDSLYAYATADSVTISAVRVSPQVLRAVVTTALSHEDVRRRLNKAGPGTLYLNYLLPAQWFISEVPMNIPEGTCDSQPTSYDRRLYKIVFTRADLRGVRAEGVRGFIRAVSKRTPLVEAWVDMAGPRVIEVKEPPVGTRYGNTPVALY